MVDERSEYLAKAREALFGAESEFANRRYNNAANRAYYACFHAAIAALIDAGVNAEKWEHDFVQAQFAGLLIHRRKLYATELREVLIKNADVRTRADYDSETVSARVENKT